MTNVLDVASLSAELGTEVRLEEPLARHCSWRVGGPAQFYVEAESLEGLRAAVAGARRLGLPFVVLGRGTNVLIADAGVRGVVIAAACDGYTLAEHAGTATLYAEAGGSLPQLANTMSKRGWAGLEWAVGIPSSIGAAVVNNCGAHGTAIADIVDHVTILDGNGAEQRLTAGACRFAYRHSRFKGQNREIVLAAEFRLKREAPESVQERLRRHNEYRRATQPSDPSAGSVFKNPPGDYAGRLIDAAGLKGVQIGGAQISTVHANFFVNTGAASAADLRALMQLAQEKVRQKFGIDIEPEIEFLGNWDR
jgi:UDP-N-acetylmuramate dehydrogenase